MPHLKRANRRLSILPSCLFSLSRHSCTDAPMTAANDAMFLGRASEQRVAWVERASSDPSVNLLPSHFLPLSQVVALMWHSLCSGLGGTEQSSFTAHKRGGRPLRNFPDLFSLGPSTQDVHTPGGEDDHKVLPTS